MATDTLQSFIEARLLAYDPDIDLSTGSPAQLEVVEPILARFQPDAFEVDLEQFITTRLKQEFPNMQHQEGTGIRDLLVKPGVVLLDPLIQEVQQLRNSQSFIDPTILAPEEADALAANLFVSRPQGGYAAGVVRLYFTAPQSISVTVSNLCFTANGLRYLPTTVQSITPEQMIFNQDGNLYYFDITVVAEQQGEAYNIAKNNIIGIIGLQTAVKADNLQEFTDGLDTGSTTDLISLAETSITERSLVTARGASARLQSVFPEMKHLQVRGFEDPEMQRDILTGGNLGPVLLSGGDGLILDAGDGGLTSDRFQTNANLVQTIGSLGLVDGWWLSLMEVHFGEDCVVSHQQQYLRYVPSLTFQSSDVGQMFYGVSAVSPANLIPARIQSVVDAHTVLVDRAGGTVTETIGWMFIRTPQDVEIAEVLSPNNLRLRTRVRVEPPAYAWSLRRKTLILSGMPGALTSSLDQVDTEPDTIHIGGCTDFYVGGSSTVEDELTLSVTTDEAPLLHRTGLSTYDDTTITGQTPPTPALSGEFLFDQAIDFIALGVRISHTLVIEAPEGNAGNKLILSVGKSPTGLSNPHWIQVSPSPTLIASGMRYRIVDEINIDLRNPRTLRGQGVDLQMVSASNIVSTTSAQDFQALGTQVDDTLRVKGGPNAGDYGIKALTGTNHRNLQLSATMKSTDANIPWEVFRRQDGLQFPLIRIKSVELLDSSQQPTGMTVPYAKAVDIRTSSFANAGVGMKVALNDIQTGIVGTTDLRGTTEPSPGPTTYPLPTCTLTIQVDDSSGIISLTGSASKEEVLSRINSAAWTIGKIRQLADLLTVGGQSRLTLRSVDHWVRVGASPNNGVVGLRTSGEDNRIVRCPSVTDWTAYDIRPTKDVLYLTTGGDIGFYQVLSVSSSGLTVVGFYENDGRVRFPTSAVNVSGRVGSRSYGKARMYFLEPTSVEVRGSWRPGLVRTSLCPANKAATNGQAIAEDEPVRSIFSAVINGSTYRFFPDPEMTHPIMPVTDEAEIDNIMVPPTNSDFIYSLKNVSGALGKNSRSAVVDFLMRGISLGDKVAFTVQPIQGTNDLVAGNAITTLPNKKLYLSLDGAPAKAVIFTTQLATVDDIASAVNNGMGETIAFIETIGATKFLRLETPLSLSVQAAPISAEDARSILGLTSTTNEAASARSGDYEITKVGFTSTPTSDHAYLQISPTPTVVGQSQHIQIYRPGVQRIIPKTMINQQEYALYFMDVELISEGPGNEWNLGPDFVMTAEDYRADGYYLQATDDLRTFSMDEEVQLVLSPTLLSETTPDKREAATAVYNQNFNITYERSPLVESIQAFCKSEMERVLVANILVRHLMPHYISTEMTYSGGSETNVILQDILDFLKTLEPTDRLEASDLEHLIRKRGASYVQNPVTLIAVVHNLDRSVTVERSQDYVTAGLMSTFFAENITVTRT